MFNIFGTKPVPHAAGHAGIAAQLRQTLVGVFATEVTAGHVGFRCIAVDRLPLVGALPDIGAARAGIGNERRAGGQSAAVAGSVLGDRLRWRGLV